MPRHKHKIKNTESLPGCTSEPRSKQFDSTLHKSLNSELKYLYTAITRAKCNLWIYDSNKKNRTPMLHYWHRKGAVRIVAADGSDGQNYSLVFASNSTPEQWSAQGDNFRKRHLWEQAILCYEKAGTQYQYLAKEARAYHYIQEARQQKPQLFLNAALAFLERDELIHSVSCLNGAALCFKNSRPPKQIVAAKLFERLGDLAKAAQCFLRAKDFDNFARIQEQRGEYNMVIRSLQGKPFMRKREALAKADEYEKKGYTLDPKLTPSVLSFSCAKFYSERKDKKILLEVLKYMPEQERRVKFLKEAELFMEAFDDYAANKQYSNAYRLAIAQGWFDKGIELAQQDQDELTEAKFILLQAKQEYLNKYFPVTNNLDDNDPEVSQNFVDKLKRVTLLSKDKLLQAEANLLLGMLNDTVGCCITALGQFKQQKHKAGRLEAFDQVITYGKVSDQEVLDCSHVAKKASASLRGTNDMNINVKQSVKFYGLQLIGKVYLTSPKGNIWLSREILKFKCDDTEHDIDGMLCLNYDIRNAIADRYDKFATIWPTMSKLEPRLQSKLQVFKLHSLLLSKRSLDQQYTPHEVSSAAMREYLQACVHFLELRVLKNESTGSLVAHILAIFSPQVYTYLPQCLNAQHLQTIRISENSRKCFTDQIDKIIAESPQLEELKIDEWLFFVWRASCITLPSMKGLLEKMNAMEDKINKAVKETKDYLPPPGYIYWKNDERFCHIFSLWLNSCVDIRERSRPLWAAKLAITHFMGNIAEDRRIKISVMNGVDILSVHCTSLLAMITNANALQNISTTFTVPLLYKHMVDHFSCMNSRKGMPDKSLLAACVEQVSSYRNLHELFRECKQLLVRAMSYLVGTHSRALRFSLLKVGIRYHPHNNATRLCLILTLTLFGNLSMLKVRELEHFEEKILSILKSAISKNDKVPAYVRNVYHQVSSNSRWLSRPGFVFNLVADLLKEAKIDSTLSKLMFKQKFDSPGHIEFSNYNQATNAPKPRIGGHPSAKLPAKAPPLPYSAKLPVKTQGKSELAQSKIEHPLPYTETPPTFEPLTEPSQPYSMPLSEKLPGPQLVDSWVEPSLPVSPPTAPIGSERRLAASESSKKPLPSSHESSFPFHSDSSLKSSQVASTLDPNAASYLPGLPGYESSDMPIFPEAAYFPASSSYVPMEQDPIESTMLGQFNSNAFGSSVFADTSVFSSQVSSDYYAAADPTMGYAGATYFFQEDTFFFSEQQDEPEGAYMEGDYGESYGLTQQSQPTIPVDPMMTEEGIIDDMNSFCNVCGISYQKDDTIETGDYDPERNLENFYIHVTGQLHHDNTISYKRFKLCTQELTEVDAGDFTLVQLAENKLKECRDLNAKAETEQLDQVMDALQDQIKRYHEVIADIEDRRSWREGVTAVSRISEGMQHILKTATDQAHKVTEVLRQKSVLKIDEDEQGLNEIEELYEKKLDKDVKIKGPPKDGRKVDGKMRTAEQKQQSREKKRSKKKKN